MEATELKDTLMSDARRRGICVNGYELMRGYNRGELVKYYTDNPDWCMERNFPSLELLRREFSDIEDKGVYVGKTFDGEVFDKLQTYIFHNCKGTINVAMDYANAVIPMLYFANKCNIRVNCLQANNPKIIVPLYVVNGRSNKVVGVKNDGCLFQRHIINLIEQ